MSSASNLAVAQPYFESVSANPLPLTARDAVPTDTLADLWQNLVRGRLRYLDSRATRDCFLFVARSALGAPLWTADEASLVRNVLCGEARKALASELGIASSTATGRYLRALSKIGLRKHCPVPLAIVLAAQGRAGLAHVPSAHSNYSDRDGQRCLYVSIPQPDTTCFARLTPVQQQVAGWLIEGCSRETIAERRGTAENTVAGQVHAIFHELHITGRYALILRACELGCFRKPVMSVA